jgi:iron complex outermembrane receptor protein
MQWFLTARRSSAFITADGTFASAALADDANTVRVDGYSVMGIRAGIRMRAGASAISPVIGVENLTDELYVPSIAINAFGGRYYEPAPGRTFFAGLSIGGAW